MELRAWRKSQKPKLTLAKAAPLFEMSIATLSLLERGTANIPRESIARIEGATDGAVTFADIWRTWRNANIPAFTKHRAAGRSAMDAYRKTAKTRKTRNT